MILNTKTPGASNINIVDELGTVIPYCCSFDTETKEAEIYLLATKKDSKSKFVINDGKVVKVKVVLSKAKAINKDTGEEIK